MASIASTKIPKIIHQIFYPFYFNEMPETWQQNIKKWQEMHPDYVHKLWGYDESLNFLQSQYPWFVETWLGYRHNIQRCDAIRYFILYHFGGLYADLDLYPLRKLDNLLVYNVLLPEAAAGSSVSNSFIGATKNHGLMKLTIDKLIENKDSMWFLGKHLHVMFSTGPKFLSFMMQEYIDNHTHGTGNDIFVICDKVFKGKCNVCSSGSDKNTCSSGLLFGHTEGQSWNKWDSKAINYVYCHWKEILILILSIIVFVLWYFGFYKSCRVVCQR